MSSCHLCGCTINSFLARCSLKKCTKRYCLNCINQKFDKNFTTEMYNSQCWICFACQQMCMCGACKSGSEKKNKRKNGETVVGREETAMETETTANVKIPDYHSEQFINSSSPFMKRLLERRNHTIRLMTNSLPNTHAVEQAPPISRTMREQIKKTILSKYADDDMDIQLI